MLSAGISALPVYLRSGYNKVQPSVHPVAKLLAWGPNPYMSTFQFFRSLETLRDSTGAGYALKEYDKLGNLKALWLLQTECVEPIIERESHELYYQVRDLESSETAYIHNSLIVAVGHISTDGIKPVNPINVLHSSLDYDREIKEFSIQQMREGLRAKHVISISRALNKDQIEELSQLIRDFEKRGILFLDANKKIEELKNTGIIDPKVFEVENITIARVARVYSIPLDKFLPEKSSFKSSEQSDLNYLRDTILPMVRQYEQELTRKLLTEQERIAGMEIKFSLSGFARADMQTRGNFYQQGLRGGWFCQDEVRELEDLPPLPDGLGKIFYMSRDMVPITQITKGGEQNENK